MKVIALNGKLVDVEIVKKVELTEAEKDKQVAILRSYFGFTKIEEATIVLEEAIENHRDSGYLKALVNKALQKRKGSRLYGLLLQASVTCAVSGSKDFWDIKFHHYNPKTKTLEVGGACASEVPFSKIYLEAKTKCVALDHKYHNGHHFIKGYKA